MLHFVPDQFGNGHYAEWHFAECHNDKCHFDERRGTTSEVRLNNILVF
jgi:hypothetical protein